MLSRVSVFIPIITSAVALALSIALLVAGRTPTTGQNDYFLALNTSKIGQDLVRVTTSSSGGGGGFDPSNPLASLGDLLNGIIGGITGSISNGIDDIEGQIVGNLTKAIGIKDTYRLFLNKICEGDFVNANDPNSEVKITSCVEYADKEKGLANITNSLPSSFNLGTANISIPLVTALGSAVGSVASLGTEGARAMFVLLLIGAISSGIVFLGSIAAFFVFRRPLAWINMGFAILAGTTTLLFAGVMTGIIVAGSNSINDIGNAFSMDVKRGNPFIAIGWVAAVFALLTQTYWFMMWFVQFRHTAFKRRLRTDEEIGNWKGIFREVLSNLRKPKDGGLPKSM